jgi:hypothetical protein
MMRSRAPMSRRPMACRTVSMKSDSCTGAPAAWRRLHCCDLLGMRGRPCLSRGKPQARVKAGQLLSQSCISWYDKRHKVRKRLISSKLSFAVCTRCAAGTGWQWWRTTTMSQTNGKTTECKQMQRAHQRQSINMYGCTEPSLPSLICWIGYRCPIFTRERASPRVSLPYSANYKRVLGSIEELFAS